MIPRELEPEVMDTPDEAADYDAMDHSEVNRVFVDDLLTALGLGHGVGPPVRHTLQPLSNVLDVGTGTARIPIELCRRREFPGQVIGIDMADEMLALARRNIEHAGLMEHVNVQRADAKSVPWSHAEFDIVMSNSIVHHIPHPESALREMIRVLKPGGLLFIRDLLRPESKERVEQIVATYAGTEPPHSQQLFRQSLWAALTVQEMQDLAAEVSLPRHCIRQTSDRHWTLSWSSRPQTQMC